MPLNGGDELRIDRIESATALGLSNVYGAADYVMSLSSPGPKQARLTLKVLVVGSPVRRQGHNEAADGTASSLPDGAHPPVPTIRPRLVHGERPCI